MKHLLLLLAICFVAETSQAQFTNDSLLNLKIQDVAGSDQVTPLIASRTDGGAYISWFDQSTGSYVLRMQRLDALGNKIWGVNGIVVSNAAQNTALFRYDLKTDVDGNAIVAFQDMRTGGMQIVAQKLDSTGAAFWATNGIVLMDADASEGLSPTIGALGNGNIIIAWNAYSASNDKWVSYYELNGITGLPVTGISPQRIQSAVSGTGYSRPVVLPLGNSQYYLLYVKEMGSFPGVTCTIYVQKCDTMYSSIWANPVLVTSKVISFFFFPTLISDGTTGFTTAFNTSNPSNPSLTSVYLQHIDSSGNKWNATGTALTSSTSINSYLGGYFQHSNNQTWVSLQVTNTGQSMAGNSIQRVNASGVNLLGTDGVVVDAQNSNIITPVGCTQNDDDAVIVYFNSFTQQMIKAVKVDSMGIKLWTPGQTIVCAALTGKDDISITPFINHSLIIVWTDSRIDNGVYAQNLNDDGSIGPLAVGLYSPAISATNFLFENPSPCFSLKLNDSRSGSNEVSIYNVTGELLLNKKVNFSSDKIPFPETTAFRAGLYFVRINNTETIKWVKE